jgi:hypothetical protein
VDGRRRDDPRHHAVPGPARLQLGPVYGDDVTPYDLERGTAAGTVTLTTKADDVMLARWNNWLYGTPTPAAGTKPVKRVPPLGSFAATLTKKDSASNTIGSFNVQRPGHPLADPGERRAGARVRAAAISASRGRCGGSARTRCTR